MFPFIQARQHGPATNLPVTRIVIHGTVSPCRAGQAQATAAYFQAVTRPASAHYVVDPGQVVQCVSEATVAYHAPPNQHSIGVELCDPQTGPGSRWADDAHEAMLQRAADLVRALAAKHDIPIVHLSPVDLLAGRSGICGHVDVTNAWQQTTHTDPGPDFPWDHFLDLITQGDDMPLTQTDRDEIAHDVLAYPYKGRQVLGYIVNADANARAARQLAGEALGIVKAIAAKTLSADEIEAAAKAGAKEAIDEEITSATVSLEVKP